MKLKILRIVVPTILTSLSTLLPPQEAFAQSFEYDITTSGNCSTGEDKPAQQGNMFSGKKFGHVDPPSDKTRKKFGLRSAETALNAGYNYIIVTPLTAKYQYDLKKVVKGGGAFSNAELVNQSYNHREEIRQKCTAVDDVTAMHLMWADTLPEKIIKREPGSEIVDVRAFIKSLDGTNHLVNSNRTPKISENHYNNIGDRERITEQYPVMAAAAGCHSNLSPRSLTEFKRSADARDRNAEQQCLETHRARAEAVKWAGFPLFTTDTASSAATRGFVLNKPKTTKTPTGTRAHQVNADVWGAGWVDLSSDLKAQSGSFLFNQDQNRYLIASNDLDEDTAIDHAVFLAMGQNLKTNYSGLALRDDTDKYRGDFERKKQSLVKQQEKEAERARRKQNSNSGSSDRKIEYKERDIERAKKRIGEISEQNDEATIAQMKASMAAFPDAKFDERALRAQLKSVREANLAARQTKLRQLEDELAEMKAGQTVGTSSTDSSINTSFTEIRPSQSYGSESSTKGIYHAFENYRTVMIFGTNNLLNTSKCRDEFFVCADKLQAYNAIGPRIGKPGFTQMSTPAGYKPYENR